jgi:hypothetical protein
MSMTGALGFVAACVVVTVLVLVGWMRFGG